MKFEFDTEKNNSNKRKHGIDFYEAQELVLSSKVVTPVKTGVQCFCNPLKSLDSGACPGPDPGFTGMTIRGHF